MDQDSPDYKFTHHSPADALEAVKPEVAGAECHTDGAHGRMARGPAGAVCFAMACGKDREDAASAQQYEMLKAFGLWKFGDLGAEGKGRNDPPAELAYASGGESGGWWATCLDSGYVPNNYRYIND